MSTWQEQAATCAVGDVDPAPHMLAYEKCCEARHAAWYCTLPTEHTTQHVAGTAVRVVAVWPVTA